MVGGGDGLHEDQHYVSENHDLNGSFSSVVSLRNEWNAKNPGCCQINQNTFRLHKFSYTKSKTFVVFEKKM
jgi:hypothetical protein